MKVFLDANVLVSVLNKEYPLYPYTSRILSLADGPKFQLYTSPICLAIAFYFSEKKSGSELAKQKIALLVSKIKVADVDHDSVTQAVANPKILDFEDGLEYYAAIKANCSHIVTEDLGDFHFSTIPVVSAHDFLVNVASKR